MNDSVFVCGGGEYVEGAASHSRANLMAAIEESGVPYRLIPCGNPFADIIEILGPEVMYTLWIYPYDSRTAH